MLFIIIQAPRAIPTSCNNWIKNRDLLNPGTVQNMPFNIFTINAE